MQKKFFYIVVIIVFILLGTSLIFASNNFFTPKKVHYHAGFVVFQNNKKIDFSDIKYMYIEPCAINETNKNENSKTIQMEKAHLHENVGDLVHVERDGATWRDLFTNISFPIDYTKTTGYINGKQIANFQSQPIQPDESLVVFIGSNDAALLSQAVTKDYMTKMAKKSTTCGD